MLLLGDYIKKHLAANMTNNFDENIYRDLLTQIAPRVIETEKEYDRLLAALDDLSFPKELTSEEMVLYNLLVVLVRFFESEKRQICGSYVRLKVTRLTETQARTLSDYFNGSRDLLLME